MTRLRPADPAVHAFTEAIRRVEELILARVPRLPLLPAPTGLTAGERHDLAQQFADAARVAARQENQP